MTELQILGVAGPPASFRASRAMDYKTNINIDGHIVPAADVAQIKAQLGHASVVAPVAAQAGVIFQPDLHKLVCVVLTKPDNPFFISSSTSKSW